MKKQKVKLGKVKLAQPKNKLTDAQLSTLISAISSKYADQSFPDIKDKLDEEYREAFKYSDYEYYGYKTDLGSILDIDIMFGPKK